MKNILLLIGLIALVVSCATYESSNFIDGFREPGSLKENHGLMLTSIGGIKKIGGSPNFVNDRIYKK